MVPLGLVESGFDIQFAGDPLHEFGFETNEAVGVLAIAKDEGRAPFLVGPPAQGASAPHVIEGVGECVDWSEEDGQKQEKDETRGGESRPSAVVTRAMFHQAVLPSWA